jgi:hypothetical protein
MKRIIILTFTLWAATVSLFAADTAAAPVPASYQIRNCKFDKLLRPENANNADGTRIVLYPAEPWKCMTWKLMPVGESEFHLWNHFTNKTFEGTTNGLSGVVVQIPFASEASSRPVWSFTRLPNGFYRVTDSLSGQALTGSSMGAVILAPWKETLEQQWDLINTDPAKLTM